MTTPDVPGHVVDFLDQMKTLTLATGGEPHATTLVYVNDGPELYIWLRQSSETIAKLGDGAPVAFAIDEYAPDWRQTKGVQGTGECKAVVGDEMGRAAELFGAKFPDLRPGATSAVTFYKITPTQLNFIDNTTGEGDPAPDEYRRESILD